MTSEATGAAINRSAPVEAPDGKEQSPRLPAIGGHSPRLLGKLGRKPLPGVINTNSPACPELAFQSGIAALFTAAAGLNALLVDRYSMNCWPATNINAAKAKASRADAS
jgi:hypothetical protein